MVSLSVEWKFVRESVIERRERVKRIARFVKTVSSFGYSFELRCPVVTDSITRQAKSGRVTRCKTYDFRDLRT